MCVEIIKVASEVLNFSRQRMLVNMRFLEPAIRMLTESPSKCMCDRSYGMGTDGKKSLLSSRIRTESISERERFRQ